MIFRIFLVFWDLNEFGENRNEVRAMKIVLNN